MRKLIGFLLFIAAIALIMSIFVFSVESVVLNKKYFNDVFMIEGTARELKVNHSDLMRVNNALLDYIKGKDVDLSLEKIKVNGKEQRAFDSTEVGHMVDVKNLYSTAKTIRLMALCVVGIVLVLTFMSIKTDRLELLSKSYQVAFLITLALVGAIVAWVAIDFDSFWDSFHYLVFSNLDWQLDPNINFMIRMYPLDFWLDVCKNIAIRFGIVTGAIFVASFIYEKYRISKRNKLLEIDVRGKHRFTQDMSSTYNESHSEEDIYFDDTGYHELDEYDPVD